jgi:leucyl aminopeptidase
MPPRIELTRTMPDDADVVAVGLRQDRLEDDAAGAGLDHGAVVANGFEAKPGQTQLLPGGDGLRLAVGLGPADEVDPKVLRRAGAAVARAARRHRRVGVGLLDLVDGAGTGPAARAEAARALAEGLVLGTYRFATYMADDAKASRIEVVSVVGGGGARTARALERGERIAEAVWLARDLVNEPGGTLTPPVFAERARDVAEGAGLTVRVWEEAAIAEAGLGGLLGVNRGSFQPPRFVEVAHEPAGARGSVALVGKGITFDSGGLSIKTADGMVGMKGDMAGAAAVLAAMTLAPVVAPRLRVAAYLPVTDNMTGPDATRVGDVLRIRNAKTVEVLNTDAEGRLVLADALSLASEAEPDAIVDLATLTGACVVALGPRVAGLMGNHDGLIDAVKAAADTAGEDVWPLPLPDHLRKGLDSDVADLRNVASSRYGGALTAGVFLREFVAEGIPWVHLDIAGPAFLDNDDGELPKGGTGFGVRLLAQLLADWKKPARS